MRNIVIPKMGMGTTEVEIFKWKVKEGDYIKEGDPIAEIESEKTSFEINSEYNGIIDKILVKEGDMVEIGGTICTLNESP
jgi:pyruvate/2-oxoglutarate dehydrogenase complex dihydrolipoamide acyltransferase (E2) component